MKSSLFARIDPTGGGGSGSGTDPYLRGPNAESEGASGSADGDELSPDLVFEILKSRRRRLVLEYLDGADGSSSVGDLAESIAAVENDVAVQQLGSQQRKRVYVALYQCHLPKLDAADLVDYDRDRGTVELDRRAGPLFDYLDQPTESSPRTTFASYGGLTVASGAVLSMAQVANAHWFAHATVFCFLLAVLVVASRGFASEDSEP